MSDPTDPISPVNGQRSPSKLVEDFQNSGQIGSLADSGC